MDAAKGVPDAIERIIVGLGGVPEWILAGVILRRYERAIDAGPECDLKILIDTLSRSNGDWTESLLPGRRRCLICGVEVEVGNFLLGVAAGLGSVDE
jgi:hypothetical protein